MPDRVSVAATEAAQVVARPCRPVLLAYTFDKPDCIGERLEPPKIPEGAWGRG